MRHRLLSLAFAFALVSAGCGRTRLTLPEGAGTPASDFLQPFSTSTELCRGVRSLQVELGLSGRLGQQRLRGRVLAGFVPGAFRLEAPAPFGSPLFIFVADGERGTLLLSRDRRVLEDAPPAAILDALIGVPLGPDDLLAVLSGCVMAAGEPASGRAYGPDWLAVEFASGATLYLQRQSSGWRLVAGRYGGLEVAYTRFSANGYPDEIQIRTSHEAPSDPGATVAVSQRQVNGDLSREPLIALAIPPGVSPMGLDELRRLGPASAAGEQ